MVEWLYILVWNLNLSVKEMIFGNQSVYVGIQTHI